MSHPGDHALGMLLDNGGIINCPLTSASLRLRNVILGECEECRKGKATMPIKSKLSQREQSNNPAEILHMDIIYIPTGIKKNLITYLLSVDDYTSHALAYRLPSKSKKNIIETIGKYIRFYQNYGWTVKRIITDPEAIFRAINNDIHNKFNVLMETTGENEHEPIAERYTRILRERMRINDSTQKYRVPLQLMKYCINKPIQDLNNTPNSKTLKVSPNQIITGIKVDYKYDISLPWGTLVDVKIPKQENSMEERIESGIVIGKSNNDRRMKVIILKDNGK
jgi:hypothetical protein